MMTGFYHTGDLGMLRDIVFENWLLVLERRNNTFSIYKQNIGQYKYEISEQYNNLHNKYAPKNVFFR